MSIHIFSAQLGNGEQGTDVSIHIFSVQLGNGEQGTDVSIHIFSVQLGNGEQGTDVSIHIFIYLVYSLVMVNRELTCEFATTDFIVKTVIRTIKVHNTHIIHFFLLYMFILKS